MASHLIFLIWNRTSRVRVFNGTGLRININDSVARHGINENVNRMKNNNASCLKTGKDRKEEKGEER